MLVQALMHSHMIISQYSLFFMTLGSVSNVTLSTDTVPGSSILEGLCSDNPVLFSMSVAIMVMPIIPC